MSTAGKILLLDSVIEEPSFVYTCIFDKQQVVIAQKRQSSRKAAPSPAKLTFRTTGSTSFDNYFNNLASSRDSGVSLSLKPLCLPGGFSTPREPIWNAAKRTFFECTGFDIDCFNAAPKLARIRAKKFEDKVDGRRTTFYVIYINISELPSRDSRRGVGIYERGQKIYDNFNVGDRSKKGIRAALNANRPIPHDPFVKNDDLELVESRPIFEIVDVPTKRNSSGTPNCSFDELDFDDVKPNHETERLRTIILERDMVCAAACVTVKPAFQGEPQYKTVSFDYSYSHNSRDETNVSPLSFREDSYYEDSQPAPVMEEPSNGLSDFTRSLISRNLKSCRK